MLLYGFLVYMVRGPVEYSGLLITSSLILFVVTVINMRLDDPVTTVPKVEVYHAPEKIEPKSQKATSRKGTSKKKGKKKSAKKKATKKKSRK